MHKQHQTAQTAPGSTNGTRQHKRAHTARTAPGSTSGTRQCQAATTTTLTFSRHRRRPYRSKCSSTLARMAPEGSPSSWTHGGFRCGVSGNGRSLLWRHQPSLWLRQPSLWWRPLSPSSLLLWRSSSRRLGESIFANSCGERGILRSNKNETIHKTCS